MHKIKIHFSYLRNIKLAYMGNFQSLNQDYLKIKEEVLNFQFLSFGQDRKALEKDRKNIVIDYANSFKKIKLRGGKEEN